MNTARLSILSFTLFGALLLSACGDDEGGGGPEPDVTEECTAGEEDCVCTDEGACAGDLVCSGDNLCVEEEVACTPGDTNCECAEESTCSDPSDECQQDDICRPRTGCAGELGCECDDGDTCDGALSCVDDVCRVENGVFVSLSGGDARACDITVTSPDRRVGDVIFPAGVRGRMRTRNELTAIALIRTEDTALEGIVAAVVFEESDDASPDDVSAVTATCYDRLGAPTDAVTPEVN